MLRGPACSTGWLWEMLPNPLLPTFRFGTPLFRMLKRLANCASYRNATRSVSAKLFPADIENVAVPGPSKMPEPQVPNRPMLLAGIVKAAGLKYCAVVGLLSYPVWPATQSGRNCDTERWLGFVPEGSDTPLLKYGVSHGPLCNRVMPVTRHPPTIRFAARLTLPPNCWPRPKGRLGMRPS